MVKIGVFRLKSTNRTRCIINVIYFSIVDIIQYVNAIRGQFTLCTHSRSGTYLKHLAPVRKILILQHTVWRPYKVLCFKLCDTSSGKIHKNKFEDHVSKYFWVLSVPVRHVRFLCSWRVYERAECRWSSQRATRLSEFILISTSASRWLPLFSLYSHHVLALPPSRISRRLGKISSDFSFSLSMIDEGSALNAPCHRCWLTAAWSYSMSDIGRCVQVYKRCDVRADFLLIRRLL